VNDAEKRLTKLRCALANLDAAMAILSPDHPDHVPDRGGRSHYFHRNELPRLVRAALREADRPLSASEIAASCITVKGLPASALGATVASVATVLNVGARRGEFVKTGNTRGARWAINIRGVSQTEQI
jgi:hypothetical protein